ncbi:response regulator transcription factor [Mangrovimonas sp. DI 80]|uniref:response regulator transcription factor n=1 Tax=Mangrovimonas sp. DI 80 TaxID=1779330 RepID=UPI0009782A02|nr:response regulator transcription factor [Mangrovimonas sp. DI 80]OMP30532.1 DNA-binding response regulator [Mangrovimonas sp. DI 80]
MVENILIVEDEYNVATSLKKGLDESGFEAMIAYDGPTAFELLKQKKVDLILLDVILPGMNGFDISKEIKTMGFGHIPIIFLSALGTTENIVKGLDTGADDYMTKPFKFSELLARIRAVSRRHQKKAVTSSVLSISDLELNLDTKIASRCGSEIKLTSTEYRLLEYFMKNKNKVLSRVDLLENVWDINFNMGTNVVDVYVNYLRNKIDKKFKSKLIHTVVGMGYILKVSENED